VFTRTYAFDSLGRMTSEGHINGYQNGWTWDLRNFAYNGSGPLRWYQRATTTNRTCEPDYGCRLASTVPYQTYGYPHYDAALNLLTRVDSTHGNVKDSATFAVGDRVTSWLGASYTYDADGNRATRTVGSTTTTYTWDASGRLLQVKTGSDSVTYAYNALGDLARRSTTGHVDRWFIWEDGQLLEELDSTAQHRVNAFAYLPGTDAPLARITGDAASMIEFVQQDGRGDVIGLTNGASVTQHLLFGPWGTLEAVSGDSLPQTRLGWKGLVWEGGAAQLYYVRSRWYDPQSQSFLSEDPLGLSGGRNTYAYADNDPVNGWDPSGLTMAPVITTASCWGFVACGGNPEGGSGWGITDVLSGLSGGGGGGGTGGLHGGGGGGGGGTSPGKSHKRSPSSAYLQCVLGEAADNRAAEDAAIDAAFNGVGGWVTEKTLDRIVKDPVLAKALQGSGLETSDNVELTSRFALSYLWPSRALFDSEIDPLLVQGVSVGAVGGQALTGTAFIAGVGTNLLAGALVAGAWWGGKELGSFFVGLSRCHRY